MAKPLDPECQALLESIAGVLSQHGLCITSESNTQYPLLGNDLDKVLREMSRNAMQSVLLVQAEQALADENERIEFAQHTHVIGGGVIIADKRFTHGHASKTKKSATYIVWQGIQNRCLVPSSTSYPHYGGKGVTICERWLGKGGFANFLSDMGERPAGMSIDRRDNSKGYEPSNCRWVTRLEQNRNREHVVGYVERALMRHMRRRGAKVADLAHAFGRGETSVVIHTSDAR